MIEDFIFVFQNFIYFWKLFWPIYVPLLIITIYAKFKDALSGLPAKEDNNE